MNDLRGSLMRNAVTTEAEASYIAWLRAKVAKNLADPRSKIPHGEVERRMAERIVALKARRIIS